ncbi:MAG: lasso peptide biosynthesis B2 protein [Propionibacteriaceae bacterium]|jgi:hypothetical protein|nr:lasso peptide biosynthesis B2 protein [Propionibacteriaceae bacterium]
MLQPRLARIPISEVPETLRAGFVALVVELGLRTSTLPRLAGALGVPLALEEHTWLDRTAPSGSMSELPDWAKTRVRIVQRILRRWPFGDTCLRQALVSGQRLRRLHPSLNVGVAKVDGEVRAHAWLVIDGLIVDPRFAAASYLTLSTPSRGSRR